MKALKPGDSIKYQKYSGDRATAQIVSMFNHLGEELNCEKPHNVHTILLNNGNRIAGFRVIAIA